MDSKLSGLPHGKFSGPIRGLLSALYIILLADDFRLHNHGNIK